MAEKRMFARSVICADRFVDMPPSSQMLYIQLCMEADNEGFVASPTKIQRSIGATNDDLKILISKGYVIPFESGVIVITHWNVNNDIRYDRVRGTDFTDEKQQLSIDQNKTYVLCDARKLPGNCQEVARKLPGNCPPSIDEYSIYNIYSQAKPPIPYQEIIDYLNEKTGKQYKHTTPKTQTLIKARYQEGFSLDDFKKVIDIKTAEWHGTEMEKYIRPDTLFSNKFEGYYNQSLQKKENKITLNALE